MELAVEDLLLEWEERRDAGSPVPAGLLCPGRPDLAKELLRRASLLAACDSLLELGFETDDSASLADTAESRAAAPFPPQIAGYRVRRRVGHGGMGVVYEAWDPELDRPVAVKVLRTDDDWAATNPDLVERFRREAAALARLKDAHVVPVYAAGVAPEGPWLAMEFVAGGRLADHVEALRAAGPAAVAALVAKAARGVAAAHARNVLHRDIKPANILLDDRGDPLVADFGLAKFADDAAADRDAETPQSGRDALAGLTRPGQQPGTPRYMAPEQFDPAFGPIGPATDVWALGVVLFELLAGKRPFDGPDHAAVADAVCRQAPPSLRTAAPDAPRRLVAVAERCLQRDPARRYSSATALADALAPRRLNRRTFLAAAAGGAATAALGAAAWALRPPPDAAYRRHVAAAHAALARDGSVELIVPGSGRPPFPVHGDGGAAKVGWAADGLQVYNSAPYGFVELLPSVPAGRWRLTVTLRLEAMLMLEREAGAYVHGARVKTTAGEQHHFVHAAVAFRPPDNGAPERQLVGMFPRFVGEGNGVIRHPALPVRTPMYVESPLAERARRAWRTLTFDVSPTEIVGSCKEDDGPAWEFAPVPIAALGRQWVRLVRSYPDLAEASRPEGGRPAGDAIGLYVEGASVTFRSAVLTVRDR